MTFAGSVLIAAGLSMGAVACGAGAGSSSIPGASPTSVSTPGGSTLARSSAPFGQVHFTVTSGSSAPSVSAPGSSAPGVSGTSGPSGVSRDGCALLADTPVLQERGMMGRHDLGGYDAMVFQFASDTTVSFYNKDVPIPLSIGWFDRTGAYVGGAELAVCNDPCPVFSPGVPYRYGVEVPKGGLSQLGVGAGARLSVGGPCP